MQEKLWKMLRFSSIYKSRKRCEDFQCVFLTEDKKCSIYDKRPLICKAFGKVKSERLTCPEGCKISNPIKEKDFLKLV